MTVLGAAAAWTNRTPLVWVAGVLLAVLVVVGMWSIGFLIAPSALLLLVAAALSQWGASHGSTDVETTGPPTVRKVLAGAVLVILGAGLSYEGVFVRELFARGCASETLACALGVTRWDAVGLTFLGLVAVAVGTWLVWKQFAVGRALASRQPS